MSGKKTGWDRASSLITDNFLGGTGGAILDFAQRAEAATWGNAANLDDMQFAKGYQGANYGLGALGMLGGGLQAWDGYEQHQAGDQVGGILNMVSGGASAGSGLLSMFSASSAANGLSTSVFATEAATAGAGAGAGGAGAATVAGAGALPIVAAVLGGAAAGTGLGLKGNEFVEELGWLGEGVETGKKRDWSDWAADQGTARREELLEMGLGETIAGIGGFGETCRASAIGAVGAAGTGLLGIGNDGLELAKSVGGGAADLAGDAWAGAQDRFDSWFD